MQPPTHRYPSEHDYHHHAQQMLAAGWAIAQYGYNPDGTMNVTWRYTGVPQMPAFPVPPSMPAPRQTRVERYIGEHDFHRGVNRMTRQGCAVQSVATMLIGRPMMKKILIS